MNIVDYCLWRGDISFKEDPFNYVDNLCISEMCYTRFDDILKNNTSMTIDELCNAFFTNSKNEGYIEEKSLVSDAPLLLKAMAGTKRFGKCRIYNYESKLHYETTEQFAAFMMDLPDHTTVIAFRGTDNSLIGWHEDLLLSYTLMPAQIDAVNYLNKHCKMFHKYRVIGHSKGGNLAIYAALNCKRLVQNRIIQIISNDGPGLRPGTYNNDTYNRLANRYYKIVPEHDLLGTIYDNAKNKIVVKSNQKGIMQHSALSWIVEGNSFVTVADTDKISKLYKEGFDKFLAETPIDQRSIVIKEWFTCLQEAGIVNVSDLANGGLPFLLETLKQMIKMRPETKETTAKFMKIYADVYATEISETVSSSTEQVINKAQEFMNDAVKNIETIINNKGKN